MRSSFFEDGIRWRIADSGYRVLNSRRRMLHNEHQAADTQTKRRFFEMAPLMGIEWFSLFSCSSKILQSTVVIHRENYPKSGTQTT